MDEQEEMERLHEFGERLNSLVAGSGMSRKEFAAKCGLNYNTVNSMVRGERYPTMWSLIKVHDALRCTWGDLMDGEVCRVRVARPDAGGFHEYVCGTRSIRFRYRGELNHCPVCGRRADVRG